MDGEGLWPCFQGVCDLSAGKAPSPSMERGRTEVRGEVDAKGFPYEQRRLRYEKTAPGPGGDVSRVRCVM